MNSLFAPGLAPRMLLAFALCAGFWVGVHETGGHAFPKAPVAPGAGDLAAPADPLRYPIPLGDGALFRVARRLDLDALGAAFGFLAAAGTPVVAVRSGVVVAQQTARPEQVDPIGRLDRANTITVRHDDGTLADYLFVAPGSDMVHVGQRVPQGAVLAEVGRDPLYLRFRSGGPARHGAMAVHFVNGPDGSRPVALQAGRLDLVDHSGGWGNWLSLRLLRVAGSASYLLSAMLSAGLTIGMLIAWTCWLKRHACHRAP